MLFVVTLISTMTNRPVHLPLDWQIFLTLLALSNLFVLPHTGGHIIDWFVHRADQSVIKSSVINQTLPSDHFCLLAHLHLSRPLPQKVYVQARNFMAADMAVFNSDLSTRLALAPPSSVDGLHQTLTNLLNQHAPASTHLVSHRHPSPWFSLVGPQLLEAKRKRRRAERDNGSNLAWQYTNSFSKLLTVLSIPLSTQQKLPTTTLKFLHALLPNSYITSQTLFLVNLNPHLFHPPSILPIFHRPSLISLPTNSYNPPQSRYWFYFFAD